MQFSPIYKSPAPNLKQASSIPYNSYSAFIHLCLVPFDKENKKLFLFPSLKPYILLNVKSVNPPNNSLCSDFIIIIILLIL